MLDLIAEYARDPGRKDEIVAKLSHIGVRVRTETSADEERSKIVERRIALSGPDDSVYQCRIRFDVNCRPPTLEVLEAPVGAGSYTNGDLWNSLLDFRRAIEPSGWRILCNGARSDVWGSGMIADWSNGLAAYVLAPKRPEEAYQTVNIFDPAPAGVVCTVEEQIAARDAFFAKNRQKAR